MIAGLPLKTLFLKFFIALIVAAATYGVTRLLKPKYKSEEVLYFPISSSGGQQSPLGLARGSTTEPGTTPSLNGGLFFPLVGTSQKIAQGVIQSRSTRERIIQDFDLQKKWRLKEKDCLEILKNCIRTDIDKNSGFLSITIELEDRKLTQAILAHLNKIISERFDTLTINQGKKNREFIEAKAEESKKKLEEKEALFIQSVVASPDFNYQASQEAYLKNRLKQQETKISLQSAKSQLASMESQIQEILSQTGPIEGKMVALASTASSAGKLLEQLQARHVSLLDTMSRYKEDSVETKDARKSEKIVSDLAELIIKHESKNIKQGVSSGLTQLRANIAALEKTSSEYSNFVDLLKKDFEGSASRHAAVRRANTEFDLALKSWTAIQTELENAKIMEARDPSRFEIIDPPNLPIEPSWPRKLMITASVFMLTLFVLLLPNLISLVKDNDPPKNSSERATA